MEQAYSFLCDFGYVLWETFSFAFCGFALCFSEFYWTAILRCETLSRALLPFFFAEKKKGSEKRKDGSLRSKSLP
ncbi:hypothetical protein [Ruminococcus sp.]|uniref:hypothetical protein n=1 Tax=Ruminococcus sp. TaxID=41978 RepID=UPI0025DEA277|nr:hypothetical protein [Ruminococcus sp.]